MDNDKFGNKNHIITTGENCQASSSDEGNSAMVSDGDRSGNSSPPSGEISLGFDEGLHHEENPTKSAIQLQGEQSKRVPLDMLIPTEQLVNLAAISQPNDVVGRSDTKNCSASSVETHANNAIDSSTDQSSTPHPLTYDSLERQSQSFRLLRKLSDAADQAPYNNDAKNSREDTIPNASVMVPTTKNSPKVGSTRVKSGTSLRRGKWTVEEETYVARVIQDFNSGFLYAPAGTTLRTYLSEKLKCDPMRITKKFTGDACIGKRVFHPAVRCSSNAPSIDKAQVGEMLIYIYI